MGLAFSPRTTRNLALKIYEIEFFQMLDKRQCETVMIEKEKNKMK